jgi:hypothetical protein
VSELIRTKEELISYLTTRQIASKEPPKSVNVTTGLRKLVLTDERQGTFISKGCVREFEFKSLGGGVYLASIKETK